MQRGEVRTMEQGLALPCSSIPQSDQTQLACLGRDNELARTSQSAHTVGTPQQVPLRTCAACSGMHASPRFMLG